MLDYVYLSAIRGVEITITARNATAVTKTCSYASQIFAFVRQTYPGQAASLSQFGSFREIIENFPRNRDVNGITVDEEHEREVPFMECPVANKIIHSIIMPVVQ